jgi:hypothetical protein
MSKAPRLRDASVQDIQLELLRRSRSGALDGEQVVTGLLWHRELWLAALLDRPGVCDGAEPGRLLTRGLVKLRDLGDNRWNADTLFILTQTREQARQLARIARDEKWGGEVRAVEDRAELDRALGTTGPEYGLLSIRWD